MIEKAKLTGGRAVDAAVRWTFKILLGLYCVTLLVPIVWLLINSLKDPVAYYLTPGFSLPKTLYFENYAFILQNMKYTVQTAQGRMVYTLPWMFMYSILWASLPSLFGIAVSTMCAYVIARYKFPGRNLIFSLGILIMIFPIIGSSGSAMLVRRQLGIYNNMAAMILTGPSAAFSGMNFLILHAAFKGIPKEYAEAVHIDGGGHLRAFLTVMLPMMLPSAWVLVILGFIGGWNDYESFLIWLPSYANIAMGVYNFQYLSRLELGISMPQILASFVIVSIPVVALYIGFQRLITNKFLVGGLKG